MRDDRLDAGRIQALLDAAGESIAVEVRERCGSTNSELLERPPVPGAQLLLAEEQTAGRGRRGRRWHASPGSALMFSLRWRFEGPVARLRGLSLAAGVAVASALHAVGARGVALKWPNDLLVAGAKLGGVLVETRAAQGAVTAVIGVGINCRREAGLETRLRRRVAVLDELLAERALGIERSAAAARIVATLAATLRRFDAAGFEAFRSEWDALHADRGSRMKIRTPDGRVLAGIAEGVAADGALLLRNRQGLRAISSGSVVRAAQP